MEVSLEALHDVEWVSNMLLTAMILVHQHALSTFPLKNNKATQPINHHSASDTDAISTKQDGYFANLGLYLPARILLDSATALKNQLEGIPSNSCILKVVTYCTVGWAFNSLFQKSTGGTSS